MIHQLPLEKTARVIKKVL